jgi:hypothetical protein
MAEQNTKEAAQKSPSNPQTGTQEQAKTQGAEGLGLTKEQIESLKVAQGKALEHLIQKEDLLLLTILTAGVRSALSANVHPRSVAAEGLRLLKAVKAEMAAPSPEPPK